VSLVDADEAAAGIQRRGRTTLTLRRILLLIPLLLLCALSLSKKRIAADEWLPIDPAELKMTSEPKAPGAPAIYLYREVDRKDLGRANTEYNYLRIKILTEEGRKYANIEIPYTKAVAGISTIRARTIHTDGSIVNFDGKIFEKTIVKSKTERYLAKTFTMPDVQVGSIVEYHFNYDFLDGFVYGSYWPVSADLFTKSAKFTLKPYDRFALQWYMPAGLPEGTEPPKQEGDGVIRMKAADVPAFQEEDYMPPPHELRFRVDFVYSEDGFDKDMDQFWKKYGKKQYDSAEKFMDKRHAMEAALSEIISASDSSETKLRKIYVRCQQVKNLSFESEGEREKYEKNKNNSVEDVWKSGVGYGRDVNLLFLALARAAGFEGYYVRLSGRSEYFFNQKRMNSSELDANAVLIKSDDKDLYFDPATKFAPFGLLPWPETGVVGLRLDRQGGTWIKTPIPDSATCKVLRQSDLKLNEEGGLEGTVSVTYTGLDALQERLNERLSDETRKKEYLEEELKDVIPVNADVELKNKPAWNSSDDKFVAEYDVKIPGWASSAGRRALVPLGLFSNAQKHTFEHAHRTYPVYFSYMFQTEDQTRILLPAGWKVDSLPKETHVDVKAAEYLIRVESKDNTLQVTRTLRSDVLLLAASYYPTLRNFYQLVRSGDEAQAVLLPGATSATK
jgi:hypothetical protein